ncbi:MAG TPA: chloride channel protein [Bryobacteraceae bacterium]|jgi:CIC family chloride channel protein|nr:chloride channel protein [Bryobacteraceae bacterium]
MELSSPRSTLRRWTEQLRNREDHLTVVLSLLIGVLVGLVVVAFILLTGRLAAQMYPAGGSAWRRVFVPVIGSLVTGFLLFRYFPNARGSGIPQTKYAIFINDGYISLKTVLGKFFLCSASLASGIALGREGPAVQIGAGIASVLGRRFGLSKQSVKALVPVGCSAALAAAFNTPIAAVLFSLEEILGDLHAPVLGTVVISSATSWIVLHLLLGDEPLFHVPAYRLVHPVEFGVYAILGVIGGLGSVFFVKLLLKLRILFMRLPKSTQWIQPVAGGLLVGLLGWFMPEVLGVGYDYVEQVLGGNFPLKTVALLAALKIVATATCYSSGNAGGIFGPSLFIGAMLGGAVGSVAHWLLPHQTAGPGAYALIGMGTAFAGIVRTPLTSVIMIFELTRDYSIIVPLMISNLISFFISYRLQREPIYEALALQEGVYLPTGEARRGLEEIRVGDVMQSSATPFPADLSVATARQRLQEMGRNVWLVGELNWLYGTVTLQRLEEVKNQSSTLLNQVVNPEDRFPYVYPDHPLSLALERMGGAGTDTLPVVSRASRRRVQGIITMADILRTYGVKQEEAAKKSI